MEGISWLEIAGGVVVTLTAVWGLVKVWVKITPTTADDEVVAKADEYVNPILEGASELTKPKTEETK